MCHLWQEEVAVGQRNAGQRATVNCSDPFGFPVCLLKTLASIAGLENDMRTERQAEGVVRTKDVWRTIQINGYQETGNLFNADDWGTVGQLAKEFSLGGAAIYRPLEMRSEVGTQNGFTVVLY